LGKSVDLSGGPLDQRERIISGLAGPVPQGVPSGFVGAKAPFIQTRGILSGGRLSRAITPDALPLS
jgi:hypothetical protein